MEIPEHPETAGFKRTAAGDKAVASAPAKAEFLMLRLLPPESEEPIDFDEAYKRLRQLNGTRQPGALDALRWLVEQGLATELPI